MCAVNPAHLTFSITSTIKRKSIRKSKLAVNFITVKQDKPLLYILIEFSIVSLKTLRDNDRTAL